MIVVVVVVGATTFSRRGTEAQKMRKFKSIWFVHRRVG
jgi:hypothetical protein